MNGAQRRSPEPKMGLFQRASKSFVKQIKKKLEMTQITIISDGQGDNAQGLSNKLYQDNQQLSEENKVNMACIFKGMPD